jgi:hypothetical protein
MNLIMDVELFDDLEEIELIEFGIPQNINIRADHFNSLPDYKFFKKFRLPYQRRCDENFAFARKSIGVSFGHVIYFY